MADNTLTELWRRLRPFVLDTLRQTLVEVGRAMPRKAGTAFPGASNRAAPDDHRHPVNALGELADVATTGALAGYRLRYDGTTWRAAFPTTPTRIRNGETVTVGIDNELIAGNLTIEPEGTLVVTAEGNVIILQ